MYIIKYKMDVRVGTITEIYLLFFVFSVVDTSHPKILNEVYIRPSYEITDLDMIFYDSIYKQTFEVIITDTDMFRFRNHKVEQHDQLFPLNQADPPQVYMSSTMYPIYTGRPDVSHSLPPISFSGHVRPSLIQEPQRSIPPNVNHQSYPGLQYSGSLPMLPDIQGPWNQNQNRGKREADPNFVHEIFNLETKEQGDLLSMKQELASEKLSKSLAL